MLSPDQVRNREYKIGASFLPYLMTGDEAKITNEWQRLVGDPNHTPIDLSDVWAVQLGSFLGPFAIDWHERKTGRALTRREEWNIHPERPWLGCHIDCYDEAGSIVIDSKVIGPYRKLDDVIQLYTPQMIGQRACTGAQSAALLVVHGGAEPVEIPITWDADYERLVWSRVDEFWACVENLTPPVPMSAALADVPAVKTYDMTGNNAWAAEAATWITTRRAAKDNEAAAKALKSAVPADAVKCFGHGIAVSRSRAGALTIREKE